MSKLNVPLITLAIILTALAAPADASPAPLTSENVSAWLDSYMQRTLHDAEIAGAAAVVVKDGEVLVERGYGFADVEKHIPADPKLTLFRPGSISKLVTWTAVMQLVELGKIDLDVDINRYLDFAIPAREGGPVTMRDLMQHTAGFEEKFGPRRADAEVRSTETYVKSAVPQRVFTAGTTPAYSNYGAALAGYIVQRVSGELFEEYVERHIFGPLFMEHSTFRQPLATVLSPLMSQGYILASKPAHQFVLIDAPPAGALTSSADDMAHFMIAHLQDGEYRGHRILESRTAKLMHNSPGTLFPSVNRMELGFVETNINGHEVIGHAGEQPFFHAGLYLFLQEGVGFYVTFNSLGKTNVMLQSRRGVFEAFADRYFPAVAEPPGVDARTSAEHGRLVAGFWTHSRRSQSNFTAALAGLGAHSQTRISLDANGRLLTSDLGGSPQLGHWIETSPFVWRDTGTHRRLAAKITKGRAIMLGTDESPADVLMRPPWYQNDAWVLPTIVTSESALVLTALCWPVAACVRRRRGTPLPLDGSAFHAYRWSKIAAIAVYLALTLWALTLNAAANGASVTDLQVRVVQCLGFTAFIGGLGAMLWNLKMVWTSDRRWPARVWSIVLMLSVAAIVAVACGFRLMALSLNY